MGKTKSVKSGRVREGNRDLYRLGRRALHARSATDGRGSEDKPENQITKAAVDVAFQVHTALGPGLLESVYEVVMAHELRALGYNVERQVPISIRYKDIVFEKAYLADLIINGLVIVELKSVDCLAPIHAKQLLTHLKLTQKKLVLLINFGAIHLKENIGRLANCLEIPPKLPSPPTL